MKKLLSLFAVLAMFAFTACEEDKGDDNVKPGGEPAETFIRLSKESLTLSPDGESVKITVYSNDAWSVSTDSDWCTISATSGQGSEDGESVTISADVSYEERTATFVFTCDDKEKSLVVSQNAKKAIALEGENSFNVPCEGGTVELAFQTSIEYKVIIPEEAQEWISQESGTRALESESIPLAIAANNGAVRSAVVRVVDAANPIFSEFTIEYTITQQGAPNRVITYTSSDGNIVTPNNAKLAQSVLSNTYENGVGTMELDSQITELIRGAFSNCTTLTTITLPESVTKIGNNAFEGCSSLASITIPESVTEIGISAFKGCSSLQSFTIPEGVTTISEATFNRCSSLKNINLPNTVTKIEIDAFAECSGLESLTIPESVTELSLASFHGCTGTLTINCNIPDGHYTKTSSYTSKSGAFLNTNFTNVVIGDNVTHIGICAFYECESLESVTIGKSVTSIGERAFIGCTKLANINIPDSVTSIGNHAFDGCTSLTSITIPDSVTEIGDEVFSGCSSLASITIPDSVTEIGERAFQYCSGLEIATIGNGVTSIGNQAFFGCSSLTSITIPDSVTEIGNHALRNCTSLTSITIPDSVTEIGNYAFNGCSSLTSITIPDSVTSIGEWAFSDCSSLKEVAIGNSVTSIGNRAFEGCSSLTSINIPESITEVGAGAFESCTGELTIYSRALVEANYTGANSWLFESKFTTLTIVEGITHLGDYVFHRCETVENYNLPESLTTIGTQAISYNTNLKSLTIPKNVTEIGQYAFSMSAFGMSNSELILNCNLSGSYGGYFTTITLNGNITEISKQAFYECYSLTSITIPDSVTKIGDKAFMYCTHLENITIPESVTSIGESAFAYCDNLKEFYCKPTTPPSYGKSMLTGSPSTIYVPSASVDAYLAAEGWYGLRWNIKGYDF